MIRILRSRLLVALATLLPLLATSLSAQIYPIRSDAQKAGAPLGARQVISTSRSYSPDMGRWNPLLYSTAQTYSPDGRLMKEIIYLSRASGEKEIVIYDSAAGAAMTVPETMPVKIGEGDSSAILREKLYVYDETDRLSVIVDRDHRLHSVVLSLHVYDNENRLGRVVEKDSASGHIRSIEEFHYLPDRRPTGSRIRTFDPATDPFTSLGDTAKVPAKRTAISYTLYSYGEETTPVIYWRWEYGRDTTMDRQEIRRMRSDGTLVSTTMQEFTDGRIKSSRAQVFNPQGDALSAADSFGDTTTVYQRAFDYIYDEPDGRGNWTTKRQYVAKNPGDPTSEERLLIGRVDRSIIYYEE